MAVVTILEEQTLAFSYNENYGAYGNNSNPSLFLPEVGETYHVVFDGTEYVCTAVSMDGSNLLGNLATFGGEDTGEPFLMGSLADGSGMTIFCLSGGNHTLAVYQEVAAEEESSGGNVLGTLFKNIADAIRSKTGGTAAMAPADFPGNIMTIQVGSGESSGESSGTTAAYDLTFAYGQFEGTGGRATVEHGLGSMPDIIFVYNKSLAYDENNELIKTQFLTAYGVKAEYANTNGIGTNPGSTTMALQTSGSFLGTWTTSEYGIDTYNTTWIYCPDEDTFCVGGSSTMELMSGYDYNWIAVTGMGSSTDGIDDILDEINGEVIGE